MRKIQFLIVTALLLAVSTISRAQDTNAPLPIYTQLEAFEAQVDTVIVKGLAPMGTVDVTSGLVSVWTKESQNIGTGRKAYGIAISVKAGSAEDVTILDYDEVQPLLEAIDFLIRADLQITSLPSFHASFTSKAGVKISSYTSNKHAGTIQVSLQSNHLLKSRVVLERDQLERFRLVIQEAKAKLDELQKK